MSYQNTQSKQQHRRGCLKTDASKGLSKQPHQNVMHPEHMGDGLLASRHKGTSPPNGWPLRPQSLEAVTSLYQKCHTTPGSGGQQARHFRKGNFQEKKASWEGKKLSGIGGDIRGRQTGHCAHRPTGGQKLSRTVTAARRAFLSTTLASPPGPIVSQRTELI